MKVPSQVHASYNFTPSLITVALGLACMLLVDERTGLTVSAVLATMFVFMPNFRR